MLAVVKFERLGGHDGSKRIGSERKIGKLEGHGKQLLDIGDVRPLCWPPPANARHACTSGNFNPRNDHETMFRAEAWIVRFESGSETGQVLRTSDVGAHRRLRSREADRS